MSSENSESVCHIEKLSTEVLVAILRYLPRPDADNTGLDDLKTCLQVQWQWYVIGLPLLWESMHLNIYIDEQTDSDDTGNSKMFGKPLRLDKLSEYFRPVCHVRRQYQNDQLLSRCRYLNICFDDEHLEIDNSPNPIFRWPIIKKILSRCVGVKYLQIVLHLEHVDSPIISSILSDVVKILAGRKLSDYFLDIRTFSNHTNEDLGYP